MNVSAISANDSISKRDLFIKYANRFMSFKANQDGDSEAVAKTALDKKIDKTMGIETLTIFPKQVIDGKTIFTA